MLMLVRATLTLGVADVSIGGAAAVLSARDVVAMGSYGGVVAVVPRGAVAVALEIQEEMVFV
jgi:hypothetical protein